MKKCIEALKQSPVITGIIGMVVAICAMKILSTRDGDLLKMLALRVLLFLSVSVFAYLISREKSFENSRATVGYVVKWGLLPLILPILLFPLNFTSGKPLAANWPVQLILSTLVCLFVGLYEEVTFRVIINDAILYKFRDSKHVFVWIALISSFIFGGVHVLGASMQSGAAVVTALLKILQTAIFGFCMLILYWKTRNILGIAIAHGIFDGLSAVPGAVFSDTSNLGSAEAYVNSGSEGMISLIGYIVALTIGAVILWIKVGRKIDFEEIRKTW